MKIVKQGSDTWTTEDGKSISYRRNGIMLANIDNSIDPEIQLKLHLALAFNHDASWGDDVARVLTEAANSSVPTSKPYNKSVNEPKVEYCSYSNTVRLQPMNGRLLISASPEKGFIIDLDKGVPFEVAVPLLKRLIDYPEVLSLPSEKIVRVFNRTLEKSLGLNSSELSFG